MSTLMSDNASLHEIERALEAALEQARQACTAQGDRSAECATAWDIVEELQTERANLRQRRPKSSLEQYCNDHPEASECRIYDV